MNSKPKNTLTYLGLLLISVGFSYSIFSRLIPKKATNIVSPANQTKNTPAPKRATGVLTFEGPKTEKCPLNGKLYTQQEKKIWETRRPLAIMIENHKDSRPQSGLQNADIVYEAVAEGGITRFMGVYYCDIVQGASNRYDVGPVRSARTYFVNLASEYSDYPLYTHVGGANCSAPKDPVTGRQSGPCTTNTKVQAIEQIADYGWNNKGTWSDLSQFSLSYKACRREPDRTGDERATEHTMYCSTAELWNVAESRGLTNMTIANKVSWDKKYRPWFFSQKDQRSSDSQSNGVSLEFWPGENNQAYAVQWKYQSSDNSYQRYNGGQPHIDFNTGNVISTKNVIIQFVKETRSLDEHAHNFYDVIGSGKGVLIQNGSKQEITWSKLNRVSRTIFKTSSGQEVNFVPGQIWIEVLPIGSNVSYESI